MSFLFQQSLQFEEAEVEYDLMLSKLISWLSEVL